jgi:hypothetical protein
LIPLGQEFHWKKMLRANHLFVLVAKVLANPAVCLGNDIGSIPNDASLLSRCIEIRISQTKNAGVRFGWVQLDVRARRVFGLSASPEELSDSRIGCNGSLPNSHGSTASWAEFRCEDACVRADFVIVEASQQGLIGVISKLLGGALRICSFHLSSHLLSRRLNLTQSLCICLGPASIPLGLLCQFGLFLRKIAGSAEILICDSIDKTCC